MKIAVRQIYVEVGVSFPFSHRMQVWLSGQLSDVVALTPEFTKAYGDDFYVVVNISARRGLNETEIKGPTVFRKTKDVEYTLFLPYDVIARCSDGCRVAANLILSGVQAILIALKLNPAGLEARRDAIRDHLCTDPAMLKSPWPLRSS